MNLFALAFLLIGLNSSAHLSDIVGASGTYTPTLTNTTNIDASTSHKAQWLRVGNTVTVSGKIEIDQNSATANQTHWYTFTYEVKQ